MRPFEKLIQEQDANQWLQPNFLNPSRENIRV